jgi:ribonuclease HI
MWKRSTPKLPRLWVFCDGGTGMREEDMLIRPAVPNSAQRLPELCLTHSPFAIRHSPFIGCGAGAVARSDDGQIVGWEWQKLPTMTNNEAEYAGLLLGLALAQRLRAQETICVLDSAVVVGQMNGSFGIHSRVLRPWHWRACEAARALPAVRFCLIPREWNRLADGLACQAGIPWEPLRGVLAAEEAHSEWWVGS